jgi:hypothetical protein
MNSAARITLVIFAILGMVVIGIYLGAAEPELIKSLSTSGYDSSLRLPLPEDPLPFEERLASTPLLLHAPVGGFSGPLTWLNGPDSVTYEYRYYSRGFGPENVTLMVSEVKVPLSTEPVSPSHGITTRITPEHFPIEPDDMATALLNITVSPEGYTHTTTVHTFWVHAEADDMPNAVADDWIRSQMGDIPVTDLGMHSSIETGGVGGIRIRKGETWKRNLTVRLGERETGPVRIWFQELDCETSGMSSLDTPEPASPDWPHISVSPDEFVGRSFGTYNLTTTIDTGSLTLRPGTYCYGINAETADSRTSTSFKIDVIP